MTPSLLRMALTACTAALALCGAPSVAHAEIVKWVDAQGRTHYSERSAAPGHAKSVPVKVAPAPAPSAAPQPRAEARGWDAPAPASAPVTAPKPRPAPNDSPAARTLDPETPAQKCRLARAVLSGAVAHGNGAPTDANDRQIAERDVQLFCGGK